MMMGLWHRRRYQRQCLCHGIQHCNLGITPQCSQRRHDIFVLKLNSSGAYQWHTFYGSGGGDYGYGIAVDTNGNVYVTGISNATWGSPINSHSGGDDIVVLKLNSSGAYQWHTFYGSDSYDWGYGITVDTNGNVYVTGHSNATWGSPINSHSGGDDIVVLKLARAVVPTEGTIGTRITINGLGFEKRKERFSSTALPQR